MDLEILKTQHGLKILNDHLSTCSYITGYQPSQNDSLVMKILTDDYPTQCDPALPHFNRWKSHIQSLLACDKNSFPDSSEPIEIVPKGCRQVVNTSYVHNS